MHPSGVMIDGNVVTREAKVKMVFDVAAQHTRTKPSKHPSPPPPYRGLVPTPPQPPLSKAADSFPAVCGNTTAL